MPRERARLARRQRLETTPTAPAAPGTPRRAAADRPATGSSLASRRFARRDRAASRSYSAATVSRALRRQLHRRVALRFLARQVGDARPSSRRGRSSSARQPPHARDRARPARPTPGDSPRASRRAAIRRRSARTCSSARSSLVKIVNSFIGRTAVSPMNDSTTASCATAARDTQSRSERPRLIAASP